MYDDVAILKAYGEESYDEYGNQTHTEIEHKVFVEPRGVYSSEFYNAAQLGLKPSITLRLASRADYNDEKGHPVPRQGVRHHKGRLERTARQDRPDM